MLKLEKAVIFLATQSFWFGLEAVISSLGIRNKCPEICFAILILELLTRKQNKTKPQQTNKTILAKICNKKPKTKQQQKVESLF